MEAIKIKTEEQHELLLLAKQGDKKAESKLIQSYLPLIYLIVGKFNLPSRTIIERDDLISEASIALFKAISDYDTARTTQFSTFAGVCIKRAIKAYIDRSVTTVKQPIRQINPNLMTEYSYENELAMTEKYNIEIETTKLWKALKHLNSNEQYVLANYYGLLEEELTEEEIAHNLKITKQRVSQILKNAITKLRPILGSDKF